MDKRIIIFGMIFLFLIMYSPEAEASSYIFERDSSPNIITSCVDNNKTLCGGGTDCFITIIKPDSLVMVRNGSMTNNLNDYNYTLNSTQTDIIGTYSAFVSCSGTTNAYTSFNYDITRSGKTSSTQESLLYMLVSFGVFVLFGLALLFSIKVPYKNPKDNEGNTIAITRTKYLKMSLVMITYGLLTWLLNILIGISNNFINLDMFFGFFGFLFTLLNNLALPLFILYMVWGLFELIRDSNRIKAIKKYGWA